MTSCGADQSCYLVLLHTGPHRSKFSSDRHNCPVTLRRTPRKRPSKMKRTILNTPKKEKPGIMATVKLPHTPKRKVRICDIFRPNWSSPVCIPDSQHSVTCTNRKQDSSGQSNILQKGADSHVTHENQYEFTWSPVTRSRININNKKHKPTAVWSKSKAKLVCIMY